MKRILVLLMVTGLVFGAVAGAEAKKKKKPVPVTPTRIEKVVEYAYSGGSAGIASPAASGGVCLTDPTLPFACITIIPPGVEYTFVKIEVKDTTGLPAGGFISQQDSDGDGLNDGYGEFCGAQKEAVALELPGAPLGISLYPGFCSDASSPSVVTTGTIVATFSNMP
jgi:hypothetical protein